MNNADRPINPTIDILKAGETSHTQNKTTGLTKREYFAGLAMLGLLAQSNGSAISSDMVLGSEYCVEMADILLKQLEEQK